jgi:hypothetical protein
VEDVDGLLEFGDIDHADTGADIGHRFPIVRLKPELEPIEPIPGTPRCDGGKCPEVGRRAAPEFDRSPLNRHGTTIQIFV